MIVWTRRRPFWRPRWKYSSRKLKNFAQCAKKVEKSLFGKKNILPQIVHSFIQPWKMQLWNERRKIFTESRRIFPRCPKMVKNYDFFRKETFFKRSTGFKESSYDKPAKNFCETADNFLFKVRVWWQNVSVTKHSSSKCSILHQTGVCENFAESVPHKAEFITLIVRKRWTRWKKSPKNFIWTHKIQYPTNGENISAKQRKNFGFLS